jgi:hypothetical protein
MSKIALNEIRLIGISRKNDENKDGNPLLIAETSGKI